MDFLDEISMMVFLLKAGPIYPSEILSALLEILAFLALIVFIGLAIAFIFKNVFSRQMIKKCMWWTGTIGILAFIGTFF